MTDGHDGLLAAVSELFSATPRQRCLVHKQHDVLNAIPRRERADVQAELVGIWEQTTKQEALTQLAAFKAKYTLSDQVDWLSLSRAHACLFSAHRCTTFEMTSEFPLIVYKLLSKAIRGKLANQFGSGDCEYL